MRGSQETNDSGPFNLGFSIGMICGGMLGAFLTMMFCSSQVDQMRLKCVENAAAHYDAKTGAFTWKNEVTE
jgi:hypothetical protein